MVLSNVVIRAVIEEGLDAWQKHKDQALGMYLDKIREIKNGLT
jgi:hypothetical protein